MRRLICEPISGRKAFAKPEFGKRVQQVSVCALPHVSMTRLSGVEPHFGTNYVNRILKERSFGLESTDIQWTYSIENGAKTVSDSVSGLHLPGLEGVSGLSLPSLRDGLDHLKLEFQDKIGSLSHHIPRFQESHVDLSYLESIAVPQSFHDHWGTEIATGVIAYIISVLSSVMIVQ